MNFFRRRIFSTKNIFDEEYFRRRIFSTIFFDDYFSPNFFTEFFRRLFFDNCLRRIFLTKNIFDDFFWQLFFDGFFRQNFRNFSNKFFRRILIFRWIFYFLTIASFRIGVSSILFFSKSSAKSNIDILISVHKGYESIVIAKNVRCIVLFCYLFMNLYWNLEFMQNTG